VTTIVYPPPRRWRSPIQAIAWTISVAGLAAFGGWLTLATAAEVRRAIQVPPTPPGVAGDVVVRDVPDRSGRLASFRILLLSDEFRWRLNSSEEVEPGPAQPIFTPEMKAVLGKAREIICVGASSEEIPAGASHEEGRAREERRAARRADQIAAWVRGALSTPVPVRKLNVGHHVRTGRSRDTSDQRRVVIILVLERDAGANLDQALRAAMLRETMHVPVFDALLTRYSLSSGDAFTWVP
jgi:hypothetical protein